MHTQRIIGISAALAAACLVTLGLCVLMPMLSGDVAFQNGQTYSQPIRIARVLPPKPKQREPKQPEKKPEIKKIQPKQFTSRRQNNPPTPQLEMPQLSFDPAPSKTATVSVAAPASQNGFSGVPVQAGFSLGEVDKPPRLVRYIPPLYPTMAKRRRIQGKVLLRALITTEGKATHISVVSSDPKDIFEDCAQKALGRWTFHPGMLDGKEVPTWIEIPVAFTLN